MMRRFVGWGLAGLVAATCIALPSVAEATEDGQRTRKKAKYRSLDLQALIIGQLVPRTFFGLDGMYAVGNETFQVRLGGQVAASRPFSLAGGEVANIVGAAQIDGCAGKNVQRHRVRMCIGGLGGAWAHQWRGFRQPGRRFTPWVAGTLKTDYRYAFTPSWGLIFGVGVQVPLVGPAFRGWDEYRTPSPIIISGPISGTVTFGLSYRFT